jgi:L-ascorbate metabolism protein UlaG (beta-lactamase superfamily)
VVSRSSAAPTPSRVHVRMYRVGFGDCFLLTFDYRRALPDGRRQRHVLVDCGTTRQDPDGPTMADVAGLITEHCGGKLDVLVVTHRHSDHLSAFQVTDTAKMMDGLKPDLVVRPWTDDPTAAIDATGPVALDDASRRYVASLRAGQDAAGLVGHALKADGANGHHALNGDSGALRGELARLALDQVANQAAIARLEGYAQAAKGAYVAFGGDTGIEQLVPGVEVEVLGPPTVAQWPEVTNQRSDDPDEFWMLSRNLVEKGFGETGLDPADPRRWDVLLGDDRIGPARWLLERLDDQRVGSLLRIVRTFDGAINNTSLILLLKVGDRRLLFSGDAQIENWSYVLASDGAENGAALREELSRLDLYKVGHHGSRNATPRSLFNLWTKQGEREHPMVALMSTLDGVHGKRPSTAVPRATLVNALRGRTQLFTTDELADGETHVHVSAVTNRDEAFSRSD